jgi:hypothetical protein
LNTRIKKLLLVFVVLSALFAGAWYFFFRNPAIVPVKKVVDYTAYPLVLDSIQIERKQLKRDHAGLKALEKAFLISMDKKIFAYWYGTKWDFNGTTQKPNEGAIACGYFVTTTLRDAGVKINRVKMAQCASEEMIKSLVQKSSITRFSNVKIADFEKRMNKLGNGLYVVGLDNHTGFIRISPEGNYFIHASGWYPYKVVKEVVGKSSILDHSNYKIVGKLSGDNEFLKKWVNP